MEPRRPFFTTSPTTAVEEGSPTMHQRIFSLRASRVSMTRTVPLMKGPSSSEVMRKAMEPLWSGCSATKRSVATTMAASDPFMSAAPRP
ncbi:hypothetical protein D3C75_448580 [compost metagenome]